jgi:hypothetical protein
MGQPRSSRCRRCSGDHSSTRSEIRVVIDFRAVVHGPLLAAPCLAPTVCANGHLLFIGNIFPFLLARLHLPLLLFRHAFIRFCMGTLHLVIHPISSIMDDALK